MKAIPALKKYFESEPHGRKLTMDELKEMDKAERRELGQLACVELGEEFEEAA
jgi:hypothetical protein